MFCPKCATQNLDGASFCRSCGANISLVPQALSGQLMQPPVPEVQEGCRTRRGRELTLEQPFKNVFMGIAFVIISIVLSTLLTIDLAWLAPATSGIGILIVLTGVPAYFLWRLRGEQHASPI